MDRLGAMAPLPRHNSLLMRAQARTDGVDICIYIEYIYTCQSDLATYIHIPDSTLENPKVSGPAKMSQLYRVYTLYFTECCIPTVTLRVPTSGPDRILGDALPVSPYRRRKKLPVKEVIMLRTVTVHKALRLEVGKNKHIVNKTAVFDRQFLRYL